MSTLPSIASTQQNPITELQHTLQEIQQLTSDDLAEKTSKKAQKILATITFFNLAEEGSRCFTRLTKEGLKMLVIARIEQLQAPAINLYPSRSPIPYTPVRGIIFSKAARKKITGEAFAPLPSPSTGSPHSPPSPPPL